MPPRGDAKRQAFIKQAIAALQVRDTASSDAGTPVVDILADRAFKKLQFDFPVVPAPELDALAKVLRDSVQFKGGCSVYKLTATVTLNAVAGALQPTVAAADPSTQQPQEQPVPDEPELLARVETTDLQGAYQRLCAAIFVSLVKQALSLPEDDACALLEQYMPSPTTDVAGAEAEATAAVDPATLSALAAQKEKESAAEPQPQAAPDQGVQPSLMAEASEAAEQDDDDCVYEDMDAPSATSNGNGHSRIDSHDRGAGLSSFSMSSSRPDQLQPPSISEDSMSGETALCGKLLHLGAQLSYSMLSHPSVWVPAQGMMASLLELLRVLGIHDNSAALQPLMLSYVTLLADRMCDVPADMGYMRQLLDALGVDGLIAAAPRRAKAGSRTLPAEAVAAFGLFSRLAMHLSASKGPGVGASAVGSWAAARQELWRQIHQHFLPLCNHCLESLCSAAAQDVDMAGITLICQVLLFYVRHPPGGTDPAKELLRIGIIRSLAGVLPLTAGRGALAEPLRQLALICAAGSADVRKWLLAVPSVKAWLSTTDMLVGGACQAHGALWQLLGAHQAQGDYGQEAPDSSLLQLLKCPALELMPEMAECLTLMTEMQQVSKGGMSWGPGVQAALRALATGLRERMSTPDSSKQVGAASSGAEDVNDDSEGQRDNGANSDTDDDSEKLRMDPASLVARRARRLIPECIRMVKGLLTAGGKTD